jgi:hypothetical protein
VSGFSLAASVWQTTHCEGAESAAGAAPIPTRTNADARARMKTMPTNLCAGAMAALMRVGFMKTAPISGSPGVSDGTLPSATDNNDLG